MWRSVSSFGKKVGIILKISKEMFQDCKQRLTLFNCSSKDQRNEKEAMDADEGSNQRVTILTN